jgi:hypothetical protein
MEHAHGRSLLIDLLNIDNEATKVFIDLIILLSRADSQPVAARSDAGGHE